MLLDLSDYDELTCEILLLLMDSESGEMTTADLREQTSAEDTHAIKYRVREYLETYEIAERIDQGEDDYGRPLPLLVRLSDDARRTLPRYRDEIEAQTTDEADLEHRVKRLEALTDRLRKELFDLKYDRDDLE